MKQGSSSSSTGSDHPPHCPPPPYLHLSSTLLLAPPPCLTFCELFFGSLLRVSLKFRSPHFFKPFRSMESGSCSIYRELLRLHFGDEGNFCEDGILAEVLDCYFIFQETFLLFIMIWQPAKDRASIQIFDPDPSHSPGAKDQRPWGWSRLWAGYYWLASPQVGRNRNNSSKTFCF